MGRNGSDCEGCVYEFTGCGGNCLENVDATKIELEEIDGNPEAYDICDLRDAGDEEASVSETPYYKWNELVEEDSVLVPVTIGFDNKQIIGSLLLDKKLLPESSDFVISIGYRDLGNGSYDLVCGSIQTNAEYKKYLENRSADTKR